MLADHCGVRAPGLAQHVERNPDLHGGSPSDFAARSADSALASTEPEWQAPLVSPRPSMHIRPGAGVAEWQTRQTQNLLPVREWGLKSLHPHQLKVAHSATQALEKRYLGHLCGKIAGGGGALCRNLHQRITADGWP